MVEADIMLCTERSTRLWAQGLPDCSGQKSRVRDARVMAVVSVGCYRAISDMHSVSNWHN